MQFCCLGSGSKGNATLVRFNDQLIMIDCGFSLKYIKQAMLDKGCEPSQLSAIIVTHEHSDHVQGVNTLAKRYKIPIYCTVGTACSPKLTPELTIHIVRDAQAFQLGGIEITPITVPHDANEPCQFHFSAANKKLGVLTDLGSISEYVFHAFNHCDALLLESNHDVDMLWAGPYPQSLKHRVVGEWGHLSNTQAVAFLQTIALEKLSTLVLGHISEKNNTLNLVKNLFQPFESKIGRVIYADQKEGFSWISV